MTPVRVKLTGVILQNLKPHDVSQNNISHEIYISQETTFFTYITG
jgi:hypothetical protein